jgi:DNA invertase Pin-like site-specific DNA recombinase
MIGAFTEFVRNIILKHQAEGIAKVKERGWIRTESVRL